MRGVSAPLVLELRWTFDAPRERIFTALTDPADLVKWWGPSGFTTPEIELDLSVGGGYRFGMQPPDGELFHLAGEFLEIDPPNRLAYTFRWEEPDPDDRETVVGLSLEAAAAVTRLSLFRARLRPRRGGHFIKAVGRTPSRDCPNSSSELPDPKRAGLYSPGVSPPRLMRSVIASMFADVAPHTASAAFAA